MSVVGAIRQMLAAGLSVEQALIAAEAMEQNAAPAASLTARQARNKRYYDERKERLKASEIKTIKTVSDDSDAIKTPAAPSLKDPVPNLETVEVTPNPPPYNPPALGKTDLGFAEVWAAYPRRQGGNSRKNAEARYRNAVKSGVDPADILAGVEAYAAHCDATGKLGTEFVKTAEAWLNGRFWESDWSVSSLRAPEMRSGPTGSRDAPWRNGFVGRMPSPPPRKKSLVDGLNEVMEMFPDDE